MKFLILNKGTNPDRLVPQLTDHDDIKHRCWGGVIGGDGWGEQEAWPDYVDC